MRTVQIAQSMLLLYLGNDRKYYVNDSLSVWPVVVAFAALEVLTRSAVSSVFS